jgi:maltose O-acetyltransferase
MKNIKRYLYLLTLNKLPCKNKNKTFMNKVKYFFLKNVFKDLGKNVNIRPNINFVNGSNISIGDYSGIGDRCFLQDIGKIIIGQDVLMGPEVMIYTSNHKVQKDMIIRLQEYDVKDIVIEDDVWIGARVIILPGVTIGRGSVIGAGSIVTRNVDPYTIVAGVPAKVIGIRK